MNNELRTKKDWQLTTGDRQLYSTNVERSLQIHLFMQNKAKLRKVKLNVNKVSKRDYEQLDTWSIRKKQSQTNPNKAKVKMGEINITTYITKGYDNKTPIWATKKQSQIHPISHQRTMNNEQRTNNKQTQFQTLPCKNRPHELKYVDRLAQFTLNLKIRKDLS